MMVMPVLLDDNGLVEENVADEDGVKEVGVEKDNDEWLEIHLPYSP